MLFKVHKIIPGTQTLAAESHMQAGRTEVFPHVRALYRSSVRIGTKEKCRQLPEYAAEIEWTAFSLHAVRTVHTRSKLPIWSLVA